MGTSAGRLPEHVTHAAHSSAMIPETRISRRGPLKDRPQEDRADSPSHIYRWQTAQGVVGVR